VAYYGSKAYSLFRWNHISMFWVTICKKVRAMLSDRCRLSCLSVTLVYCGQTVRWLKNKLGMEVGLGPGHIMLHKDPAPLKRGTSPHPVFGPCLLCPNGWMDQDATFEDKIKTTYKNVTENSDASSKNLKVSRKSSTRSTSDSNSVDSQCVSSRA